MTCLILTSSFPISAKCVDAASALIRDFALVLYGPCGFEGPEEEPLEGIQDVVTGFVPLEVLRVVVAGLRYRRRWRIRAQRLIDDGHLQYAFMTSGKKRSMWLGDKSESGVKVNMPTRTPCAPVKDRLRPAGRVVVHDDLDAVMERYVGLDVIKQLPQLAGGIPQIARSDDRLLGNVKHCKQRSYAFAS